MTLQVRGNILDCVPLNQKEDSPNDAGFSTVTESSVNVDGNHLLLKGSKREIMAFLSLHNPVNPAGQPADNKSTTTHTLQLAND